MPDAVILRGARVIDPAAGRDAIGDVGIADGLFVPVASLSAATVVDLSGYVLAPGFIDLHVHLRDPGQTHKEDIGSGTRAAAAGGFTTVVAMPNTEPAVDHLAVLADVQARIRTSAQVRVLQTAALTLGRRGQSLTSADALRRAGAAALTDDGACVQDEPLMREAMVQARQAGILVIDHCEDAALAAGGVVNTGPVAVALRVPGMAPAAESAIVERDIRLARETGCRIHLQHLSAARSIALLRQARAEGLPVTGEVTPHHLCLNEAACLEYGTLAKMNPPLRTEADRQAVIEGVRDGTITVIATDHAPHAPAEKARPFANAPFGITGLETAISLCLQFLYHRGVLTLPQLVACFTSGPRRILGVPYGALTEGAPADVTVLAPDCPVTIDLGQSRSRSRNSPFHGWSCRGRAVGTMVGGHWLLCDIAGQPHIGP